MSWEIDFGTGASFYDTTPPRVRLPLTRDDRQRTARVQALWDGWPLWMANVEAAVTL